MPTVDIVGVTGMKVFSQRLLEVQWDRTDRMVVDDDDSTTTNEVYYGLNVVGVGDAVLAKPVKFSAKEHEVGYGVEEGFESIVDETSKVWGYETGSLVLASPIMKKANVDKLEVGSRLDLKWEKMICLSSRVEEVGVEKAPAPLNVLPSLGRPITTADLGHGVDVIGMTGLPLGTVCWVKGKWDLELRSKRGWLFHVSEVNGVKVECGTWNQNEVLIHDFATGVEVTIHENRNSKKYRGEEFTFLGCEIGGFEGDPPGSPSGGGQQDRSAGFYTSLVTWKK